MGANMEISDAGNRVGFIGLGAMGGPMAANLVKKGFVTAVYDIDTERVASLTGQGAEAGASCKDVAEKSDIIVTMLPSSPHVREAVLGQSGIAEGVRAGAALIDMSTIDPLTTKEMEKALLERGAKMLDAPVARGVAAAVAGSLAVFVGGDEETFERCKPVISAMATDIHYVGDLGSGEVVKLVNNLILAVTVCALAEGLVLGVKAGVDPGKLFKALSQGSANSFALQNHFRKFVYEGKFEQGVFPVKYILKDLGLVLETAERIGVPQYFGALASQTYQQASAAGYADRYYPVVVKILEELTGVEVRADLSD